MKLIRNYWLIGLIILASLFTRFYRLPATLTFLEDEGRDLLVVKRMLDTGRPVLLGPQTSTGNMYLGPLYYYLITPPLVLSRMDPLGPAVFIALTGVATVYLLYRFGASCFGRAAGYLAALMYAVLPLPTFFTRNSWNPNLVPLISLLTIWAVLKLTGKDRPPWTFFVLGALFATLLQLHYMSLVFLAGASLVVGIANFRRPLFLLQGLLLGLLGFALLLSPFIIFEFRNQFVNTQALLRFAGGSEGQAIRYSLPLTLLSDKLTLLSNKLFPALFGRGGQALDPHAGLIALTSLGVLLLATYRAVRDRASTISRSYLVLSILFFLPFLALSIYQENIHLHYLGFLFPLGYLLVAGLTAHRALRPLGFILVALSTLYSLPTTYNYLKSGATNQAVRAREVAEYIAREAGDRPYNVVSTQGFFTAPFQYYLALQANPPDNELANTIFVICEGSECSKEEETTVLLFLTGPAHPSLAAYLGHPQLNSFDKPRTMVQNQHVSHGIWVAELVVE